MDNYEKDLTRLRKSKEFLLQEHNKLYADYVRALAELEVKNTELTEALEETEKRSQGWQEKEQEYIDRANAAAAEQMEMAIKIKHLDRELGLWEKGKKKYKPTPRKKAEDAEE